MNFNSARDIISEYKQTLTTNKKFILIYLAGILFFVFSMFCRDNFIYFKGELIGLAILLVFGSFGILYGIRHKKEPHKVAFVIILLFGLLMVFFAPPMSFPDEAIHFARAESITEGVLYPVKTPNGYYIQDYFFEMNQAKSGTTILEYNFSKPISDSWGYWPASTNTPFYSYLFSALGILIAKCLDLSVIWTLWLGRLANLLLYGGFVYFAIKKAPVYKMPLLFMACLPIAVSQVSSFSYDAFIFACTVVMFAYFIYMYKNKFETKDLAIFFIACLLMSFIKPPYVFLALSIFAVPKENFPSAKLQKYSAFATFAVFVIVILHFGNFFNQFIGASQHTTDYVLNSRNASFTAQMEYIMGNPAAIGTLLLFAVKSVFDVFVVNSTFYHFADFKGLILFNAIYLVFFAVFSVGYQHELNLSRKRRLILTAIVLLVYFSIFGILYCTWTPVGASYIVGIQTRYFVPMLPLIPLIVNIKHEKFENRDDLFLTLIIVFLAGLFFLLFHIIISYFF